MHFSRLSSLIFIIAFRPLLQSPKDGCQPIKIKVRECKNGLASAMKTWRRQTIESSESGFNYSTDYIQKKKFKMAQTRPKFRTLKKILHAGTGRAPEYTTDTKAIFDYEVLMPLVDVAHADDFPEGSENYKSIDSTKKVWPNGYGKPLELIFGKKFQLTVLENCLSTMLVDEIQMVDEVSRFDIDKSELYAYPLTSKRLRDISRAEVDKSYNPERDEHHHHCAASGPMRTGYSILDELIENPKPLRFIVHLHRVLRPDEYRVDSWQLNATQKMESLERYRQEGNTFFSNKKYAEAATKYKEALGIIDNLLLLEKPGDAEWVELDKKNIPFYLNLSQCYLCEGQFYEASETASEALKRDEFNEKALFRRAKARIGSWDLELAEQDLKLLAEHHPNVCALVAEQFALIAKKRKEKEVSDRAACKAMIHGLAS